MRRLDHASPINWNSPLNRGLLRWWLCLPDRNRGNVWRDLTRKTDMAISGATVAGSRGRPGGAGCYEYDGVNDRGQTAAIDLSGTSQLTISMWVYVIAYALNDLLLESSPNANSNTAALQINIDNTGLWSQRVKTTAGNNTYHLTPRPSTGEWFHYTLCMDRFGGSQQIRAAYINGVSQTLTVAANDTDSAGGFGNYQWNLCSRNAASLFANVLIDDFRMFNRVWSLSEAKDLYRDSARGNRKTLRWLPARNARQADAAVGSALLKRMQTEGLFVGGAA